MAKVTKQLASKITEGAIVAENAKATTATPVEARTFTYVGGGDNSPHVINFMGKQKFVRGKATEVTDPEVITKLIGCSTFVEGEVDQETLHKIDMEGKEKYDTQRAADAEFNAKFSKKHRVE